MLPDTELSAKIESDEKQKLDSIRSSLSPEQVGGGQAGVHGGACVDACAYVHFF
jgi:hypothetical protein